MGYDAQFRAFAEYKAEELRGQFKGFEKVKDYAILSPFFDAASTLFTNNLLGYPEKWGVADIVEDSHYETRNEIAQQYVIVRDERLMLLQFIRQVPLTHAYSTLDNVVNKIRFGARLDGGRGTERVEEMANIVRQYISSQNQEEIKKSIARDLSVTMQINPETRISPEMKSFYGL